MTETIAPASISKKLLHGVLAACILLGPLSTTSLQAQPTVPPTVTHERGDIAGDWQGTVEAGKPRRLVLRIAKADKGWTAKLFLLDDAGTQTFNATGVLLDHSTFKFSIDLMAAAYEGTLSPDENSITGSFTMGATPHALALQRATKETAWEIPPPPTPSKPMATDADPAFEVATIKPSKSTAMTLQGISVDGRNFTTHNSSLMDLMTIAYGVHVKQIVGAPDWTSSDRYDIDAIPDVEGEPNLPQLRIMIGKLLADRFSLTFHHEKRDLSAYVLEAGKTGLKLTPTESKNSLPGFGMQINTAGLTIPAQNSSMADFVLFLQTFVLDRPVVDHTGIAGKFDFFIKFTPDESQFSGHPPKISTPADTTVEPAPDLFKALQDQDGLKLSVQKIPVDVLVLDHVEKPSPN